MRRRRRRLSRGPLLPYGGEEDGNKRNHEERLPQAPSQVRTGGPAFGRPGKLRSLPCSTCYITCSGGNEEDECWLASNLRGEAEGGGSWLVDGDFLRSLGRSECPNEGSEDDKAGNVEAKSTVPSFFPFSRLFTKMHFLVPRPLPLAIHSIRCINH